MFNEFVFVVRLEGMFDRIHPVQAPKITIGRSEDSTLRLIHYAVSRPHAFIERTERGFLIHDLGSLNGTKVNGRSIDQHLLREFDVVCIGPFSLKVFLNREAAESDARPSDESTRSSALEPLATDLNEELKKQLTPSLHDVFDGLMDGYSEKEIVHSGRLRKSTVHCYVGRIYKALNVHSHSELIAKRTQRRR